MNRVRELDLERSKLVDELMKLVKMGKTDYENDSELRALCSKIDDIGGRLSQLGESGYRSGSQIVDSYKDADDSPIGIANPTDYMSIVQEDTDNDGDIDKVSIEEKNEED